MTAEASKSVGSADTVAHWAVPLRRIGGESVNFVPRDGFHRRNPYPAASQAMVIWRSAPEYRPEESSVGPDRLLENQPPQGDLLVQSWQPFDQWFHGRIEQHGRLALLTKGRRASARCT